jgi:hypothetical protein
MQASQRRQETAQRHLQHHPDLMRSGPKKKKGE